MKDSHIGAYGVIALVLSLILRWSALTILIEADMLTIGLIAVATLSRAPMVVMMAVMPHAPRWWPVGQRRPCWHMKIAQIAVTITVLITLTLLNWVGLRGIGSSSHS